MILRRFSTVFLFGLISVLLQGTILRAILPGWLIPNLIVLGAVFLGFYEGTIFGALLCFMLGLQLDLAGAQLLGPWAGALVVVFGLVSSMQTRIFVDSPLAASITVFACSLVASGVYLIISYQFQKSILEVASFSVAEGLITALLAPLLFPLLRYLLRIGEVVRRRAPVRR